MTIKLNALKTWTENSSMYIFLQKGHKKLFTLYICLYKSQCKNTSSTDIKMRWRQVKIICHLGMFLKCLTIFLSNYKSCHWIQAMPTTLWTKDIIRYFYSSISHRDLCSQGASNPTREEDTGKTFFMWHAECACTREEVSRLRGSFPGKDVTRAECWSTERANQVSAHERHPGRSKSRAKLKVWSGRER